MRTYPVSALSPSGNTRPRPRYSHTCCLESQAYTPLDLHQTAGTEEEVTMLRYNYTVHSVTASECPMCIVQSKYFLLPTLKLHSLQCLPSHANTYQQALSIMTTSPPHAPCTPSLTSSFSNSCSWPAMVPRSSRTAQPLSWRSSRHSLTRSNRCCRCSASPLDAIFKSASEEVYTQEG